MKIIVSGGAGFIGSNFVRYLLEQTDAHVVVLDKLTHAGNRENLTKARDHERYGFMQGDIADLETVRRAIDGADIVINFAAESHVDRSILEPEAFLRTNVQGTFAMLEACRRDGVGRYLQVSTDEVYGEILEGSTPETAVLQPRSPYAASKAAGDLLVAAYHVTYGLPTLLTRGCNAFGPHQYPDRLIPITITEAIDDHPVPVYGDGLQIRDWLYVEDHCSAIDCVARKGIPGETYNIGAANLRTNLAVVERLLDLLPRPRSLVEHVPDRPGHDRGYSVDSTKLRSLGWNQRQSFEQGLEQTVAWYLNNETWWRRIRATPEYQEYFRRNYERRASLLESS